MKKIFLVIFCLLIFLPISVKAQERQEVYIVNISFHSGKVALGEVYTKPGFVPDKEGDIQEFSYWLRVVSFDGKVLDERVFSVNPRRMYAPLEEGEEYEGPSGEVIEEQLETAVILPYFKEGKWVELMSANRELIERKDIGYLSDMCGDGQCQEHESAETCISDCPVNGADDYCDVNNPNLDPDCKKIILNQNNTIASSVEPVVLTQKSYLKYIVILILLLTIIGFIYGAYRYFKSKNSRPQL